MAVKRVGCLGLCAAGPLVQIPETGELFSHVPPDTIAPIVDALAARGCVAEPEVEGAPFFSRQVRIVTEYSGSIDPESLDDYVAAGGYEALRHGADVDAAGGGPRGDRQERPARPRRRRLPDRPEVEHGGQGGRAPRSTCICNADEGDPGAFMDRSVLESDPHRVLEGMAIAAYAVGATKGYVYCRAEYPLAVSRLRKAIREATRAGYLGQTILDTEFSFEVDVRLGAGRIRVRRGDRADRLGRGRPGHAATAAAVSRRCRACGASRRSSTTSRPTPTSRRSSATAATWFAAIGTEKSKGTKVFALAGRVAQHRAGRGADGHRAARDRLRHRRRDPRRSRHSRPCRPVARRAAASRPSSSTCRSTTSRSWVSARSWARAA